MEHLHGPVLLGVLCLVIFVEECGVPVPLAPGDLLLALCGLAIRTGGLNPVLAPAAVFLATIAGAMAGRELFAAAGSRLMRRLTGSTRLRGPLERAARLVERGGWRAVILARLTPGLRIHTTEVAGLLGLPRRTFLLGLAPAAAVYVGVFTGAGVLVGRPAIGLLVRLTHGLRLVATLLTVLLLWAAAAWLASHLVREREPGPAR
jgi:membrane-associated protein